MVAVLGHATSEDISTEGGSNGIPWNLLQIDVAPATGGIFDQSIDGVDRVDGICFRKFICFGPSRRDVSQPLLNHGVRPGEEEVDTILDGRVESIARYSREEAGDGSLDAGGSLRDDDVAEAKKAGRKLRVDFARQEEAKVLVSSSAKRVELFHERVAEPFSTEMAILQQNPRASFGSAGHHFLGRIKAFGTSHGNRR